MLHSMPVDKINHFLSNIKQAGVGKCYSVQVFGRFFAVIMSVRLLASG